MTKTLLTALAAALVATPALAQEREPTEPAENPQAETRRRTATDPVERPAPEPPPADPRLPSAGPSLFQQQTAQTAPRLDGDAFAAASFLTVAGPEPRVFEKHDLVTIIVRESSKAESEAEAEVQKSAELRADLLQFFRPTVDPFGLENLIDGEPPRIDISGSGGWEGEGEYEREDNFVARITGEVMDVKPNGNLVIHARKHIQTDEERQVFLLVGTVRAEDVTADNTVLSTELADLDLRKFTDGQIRKAVEQGILPKIYNTLNPF